MNVLMIGTGEYTTGYVGGTAADSDKGAGVVALVMMDLRRLGVVDRLGMCGVNGTKFPGIRNHMQRMIADQYDDMDISCETFPSDTEVNPQAFHTAIQSFQKGDVAIIFTPDDSHYEIALACIQHGMHVMITKPIVQTLEHHQTLMQEALKQDVLVAVEVHKRLDPFYADARDKTRSLGDFNYLYAYMSQPQHQLETFKAWAGKSSDISYYLNSHHIDWTEWTLHEKCKPVLVTASASHGIADKIVNRTCEDSITLTVQWLHPENGHIGIAVYTSSWVAAKADVHSQQRFFYMGSKGEITVDQAHRGCTLAADKGLQQVNPLFMKYTPTFRGDKRYFSGQSTYGYQSLAQFVEAAQLISAGEAKPRDYDDGRMATVYTTLQGTAILEAGRQSLDNQGRPMEIRYNDESNPWHPTSIGAKQFD